MQNKAPLQPGSTGERNNHLWDDFIHPVRMTVWVWKISGLYNGQPQSRLYRAYRYTLLSTLMAVYLFTLCLNMFVMQTFEQLVLYIMYIVFTEIVMVVKGLLAYYKFDQICALYRQSVADCFRPMDELEQKLRRKGVGEIKLYTYMYFVSGCLAVGSSLLYLLHQEYRMPYFPWMFGIEYGPQARVNYGLIFGYQVFGMFFHMLVNVEVDMQICYLLGMVGVQLDLVGKRFRTLSTSEQFQLSFVELVRQYEMVQRMVREVEQLYSVAYFAQFSSSGLVICATAFKASSMLNLYELPAIQNLLYMVAMMFQMFLPCRFGNEVTRKSDALRTAIYSSLWYEMRLKDRKTVHMLLQRMNKPFRLTGYHFFNYNLQAYTSTLNMAYSVYALLQRTTSKRTS